MLQVVLPMLAAPLCVVVHHRRATWWVALVVTWASFANSVALARKVYLEGPLSYFVGGWEPPWGIELRIDELNAFVLCLVSAICAVVLIAAPRSFDQEVESDRHHLAYAAFLLCMTGLMGIASAGDAFNVFVFLEISSLSSYGLIALGPSRRALSSALRYLIVGTLGGTFILLGVGLLYMSTGTLNLVDLQQRIPASDGHRTIVVAMVCVVVGACIKLALVPLHGWLPDAYTFAPSVVTAFLAATATKVAFYVLARFLFSVFGVASSIDRFHVDWVLLPLALVAMVYGAAAAIFERDVKRMLAYSSLSQIGYMVVGLALVTKSGLTGGIVHLVNHGLMKCGLFLAIACVVLRFGSPHLGVQRLGSTHLDRLRGLGRSMPWTSAAFVLGGLSMIGVPATVGFVSKWYLVLGAFEAGKWWVAALILFSSALAIAYVWKVVEVLYFADPPRREDEVGEAPWWVLGPTWVLVGASLVFGVWTAPTVRMASAAAEVLLPALAGAGP
ncbi:MAG: monovalent cation/H+ antiporter subunit D family protein [Thermoanaerobaculia bacterium]|nr:monovalent cation/H+ antiporter subunit D family protein [Thermoanaerobaculia bacterium]